MKIDLLLNSLGLGMAAFNTRAFLILAVQSTETCEIAGLVSFATFSVATAALCICNLVRIAETSLAKRG